MSPSIRVEQQPAHPPPPGPRQYPPLLEGAVDRARRPLTWLWARGFRFLFVLDAVGLFGSMLLINLARFGTQWPTYPVSHYLVGFCVATSIHILVGYFAGLYERDVRLGPPPWLPRVATATAIAVAVEGLAFLLTGRYLMPRLNLVVLFLVATGVVTANRSVSRRLAERRRGPARVLLVGEPRRVNMALRYLRTTEQHATVVGDSPDTEQLLAAATAGSATDVLLLELAAFESAFPEPLEELQRRGVDVHQRVSAQETLLGLRSVRQVAGMPFTRVRTQAIPTHQLRLKRALDLALLIVTLPVAAPTLLGLALYVLARAGRPVFYRQTRMGFEGACFALTKFRTMGLDAELDGPKLAEAEDARVLPGMRWMRRSRADEVPQLWNVLRGEMSFVGPRPERPEIVAEIERDIPGYSRRHELPPGLTGLAQVQGRYHTAPEDKLGYDLQYLVNWSLLLDVQILARTIWVIVSRRV
jgi:exopolysaccharide biosynthesis polyprenyl glycosylphosphotransferase